jgi:hypothetical protein
MANNIITALSEAAITDAAWGFEFKYNKAEHIGILDNTLSSLARVLFDKLLQQISSCWAERRFLEVQSASAAEDAAKNAVPDPASTHLSQSAGAS